MSLASSKSHISQVHTENSNAFGQRVHHGVPMSPHVEIEHAKGNPLLGRCVSQSIHTNDHSDMACDSPEPPRALTLYADHECAFCGQLGTTKECGDLLPVVLGDKHLHVHHACALWAPKVYQLDGSSHFINLDSEWTKSLSTPCTICGTMGASVTCMQRGCNAVYHLPCAANATDIVLDKTSFELWCPSHAFQDSEDDEDHQRCHHPHFHHHPSRGHGNRHRTSNLSLDLDFIPSSATRPKRHAALTRRHRYQRSSPAHQHHNNHHHHHHNHDLGGVSVVSAMRDVDLMQSLSTSDKVQRPRTDWQRRGDVWVKVVPPWWGEQRTVHFANKVFRELFCSGTSAILVDAQSDIEYNCIVHAETRNDLRLQYTLRGEFQDYWEASGVKSGDVLSFERNKPSIGKILITLYPCGAGVEEALAHQDQTPLHAGSQHQSTTAARTTAAAHTITTTGLDASTLHQTYLPSQLDHHAAISGPGSSSTHHTHPNRWVELADGSAVKTVYKSTLVHHQLPIAGWLFNKLYGRYPSDNDKAPIHDPELHTDFNFDVSFLSAANIHYIVGRSFGTWLHDADVKAGDQIRVWKDVQHHVFISHVPANKKIVPHTGYVNGLVAGDKHKANHHKNVAAAARPCTAEPMHDEYISKSWETVAGDNANIAATFSPPCADAVAALDALAAAARYAAQNGTPAIQAVLAYAADIRNSRDAHSTVAHAASTSCSLEDRLAAAGLPLPPSPFAKKRKVEMHSVSTGTEDLPQQQQEQYYSVAPVHHPLCAPASNLHIQMALQRLLHQAQHGILPRAAAAAVPPAMLPPVKFPQQSPSILNARPPSFPVPSPTRQAPTTTMMPGGGNAINCNTAVSQSDTSEGQHSHSMTSFQSIMHVLGSHQWSPAESALIVQFRAKYALLDAPGRDIAYFNIMQLKFNKEALLEMLQAIVDGEKQPSSSESTLFAAPAVPAAPTAHVALACNITKAKTLHQDDIILNTTTTSSSCQEPLLLPHLVETETGDLAVADAS